MVKQRMDLLELLRKRGMDGDVDFLREALRVWWTASWTPRFPPRSALSTANAAQSGSPTATATATAPGIPGWAPWSCTFPSCGKAATSPAAGTTAAQREGSAVGDPAGLRGGSLHPKGGRPDQGPGCDGISSSQVSRICEQLDEVVDSSWVGLWTVVPTPTSGWTA